MYSFVLILMALLSGTSCAIPTGFDISSYYPYDYYNSNYQPSLGSDLLRPLFPFSQFASVNSPNYLDSAAAFGSDLLSTVPSDFAYNYPYASTKSGNVDKQNYLSEYGYGSTEVGVGDHVSVRPSVLPFIVPNYLTPRAVTGPDLLSTVPTDFANNNPFVLPRIVNVVKENYLRDNGYGSGEVGIRDQVSVRPNTPDILPPFIRPCSILPIRKRLRRINRFNQQATFRRLPINYDIEF